MGVGRQTRLEGLGGGDSGGQKSLAPQKPRLPPPASNVMQMTYTRTVGTNASVKKKHGWKECRTMKQKRRKPKGMTVCK